MRVALTFIIITILCFPSVIPLSSGITGKNDYLNKNVPINSEGTIVFVSDRDDNLEIYKMNSLGAEVTRLTNHPASDIDPVWSPNGNQIAFISERYGNPELVLMNQDGHKLRRLTSTPDKESSPSWSPDGNKNPKSKGSSL